jgi:3-oxoacyl-[acyl-carrier protein] reductase
MMKKRAGRIINITSIIGHIGNAGQTSYAASKAGMLGFTKSLAKEIARRGITVNAIAPGFIETEMTQKLPEKVVEEYMSQIPLARFGKPEDVASAVRFLASDNAGYITGTTVHVNGGLYV